MSANVPTMADFNALVQRVSAAEGNISLLQTATSQNTQSISGINQKLSQIGTTLTTIESEIAPTTATSPSVIIPVLSQSSSTVPPATLNAFFVSPTGSDSNAGTRAAPYKTLERAQTAMRAQPANGTKTTVLLDGTFTRTSTLVLTSSDNSTTWQHDPQSTGGPASNGYGAGIIDGGTTVQTLILINGASNITINGLQFQNGVSCGVGVHGGSAPSGYASNWSATATKADGNTIENCFFHNFTSDPINVFFNGGVIIQNQATNTKVYNNVVHDCEDNGIRAGANDDGNTGNDDISGTDIENNVVYNIGTGASTESAGIYTEDGTLINTALQKQSGGGTSSGSTNIKIINNIIWNYSNQTADQGRGIYLDEGSSNHTVSGNIIGPPGPGNSSGGGGTSAYFLSTGNSNTFTGNIVDLGAGSDCITMSVLEFGSSSVQMTGNTFTNNIVIANFAGASTTNEFGITVDAYISGTGGFAQTQPNITNNAYHNYGGGAENTSGNGSSDSNPQHISAANLKISTSGGVPYTVDPTSQAVTGVVAFPGITGGWGPPGFASIFPTISPAHSYP